MSGRKQHEIPQLYLRGFLIDDRGDKEQVFQYRKGHQEPFLNSIKDACAQRDFNANAPTKDHRDLDDEITKYEDRLGTLIKGLRNIKDGESIDPQIVAEAVSHLTVRNAHIAMFPMLRSKVSSRRTKTSITRRFVALKERSKEISRIGNHGSVFSCAA